MNWAGLKNLIGSVSAEDIKVSLSDMGTFTGDIESLFNNLDNQIIDDSATALKWFEFFLEAPMIGGKLGINTASGDFSNVKVILKNRQGNEIYSSDDSSNNTKYTNHGYAFPVKEFCCVRVEFHTIDRVDISGIFAPKENRVVARIQAQKPDGELVDLQATTKGNAKVSIEEIDPTAGANQFEVDDYSEADIVYLGYAEPGALKSDAKWQIIKIDESGNGANGRYADDDNNFSKVWDDRLTYIYN